MLHAQPGWINDRSWEFWRGLRGERFFELVKHLPSLRGAKRRSNPALLR
jgi:hypothetical protein